MQDFRFSNDPSGRNIDGVAEVLLQPRLWIPDSDYPGYGEWYEKALSELETDRKRAMLAWWGGEPVGAIVYQRHPKDSEQLEIKNISVESAARGRHVASFLLRQVEIEGQVDFPGVQSVVADTKHTNMALLGFVFSSGYQFMGAKILDSQFAHNGVEDVVFGKAL